MPNPPADRCYALVPCAGVGARAGTGVPKQYASVAGTAMVARTLAALDRVPRIEATLVALSPGDASFVRHVPPGDGRRWVVHCGGATRAATVAAGLAELARRGARDADWVLVHDAARCLVSPAAIERLIDACLPDAVGGLLALPLADTLKQARPEPAGATAAAARVAATIDRSGAWAAQTPQMFRLGLLQQALAAAGDAVTDDAGAVEALGHAPLLVVGERENFKLTWPEDFAFAERLLASRAAGGGDPASGDDVADGLHPY